MGDDVTEDKINTHVGKKIRTRRRYLKMNQPKLGSLIGVTYQQIQKYETGAVNISIFRLWQLSVALKVSVKYFFDELTTGDSA